jgi:hypothetical protein
VIRFRERCRLILVITEEPGLPGPLGGLVWCVIADQQPVAGLRNPGNGFRSPMSVYLPVFVDRLCVGSDTVLGAVRMNQGRNASSSGW